MNPTSTPDAAASRAQSLKQGFTAKSALALAFADVSPIVALYTIFALGLVAAGPAFFWGFLIVLAGQLLVALVFGELASRWPYEGSIYQWARHVHSTSWGWFAAWAYMWGLTIALSALSYGAADFLLGVFGASAAGRWTITGTALAICALGSLANMIGRRVLKVLVVASLACEVLASVVLGTVLLAAYRVNPVSVLFDGFDTAVSGSYLTGPFLVAVAFIGWSFVGFESAGSIAEEVKEPERAVPRALFFSLLLVALIVMYTSIALILSIPNLEAVMSGKVTDPVAATLTTHFGNAVGRPMLAMFVIGFLASFLAVQAAVSRVIWASARDLAIPGARALKKLAGPEHLPVYAIALTFVAAAIFVLLAGSNLYAVLVNFTTIGFYVSFGIPVWGTALSRLRGSWQPGTFNLGRFSAPVTYLAAIWLVAETINIAWPRNTPQAWYIDWAMLLMLGLVAAAGMILYARWSRRILPTIESRQLEGTIQSD